MIVGAAIPACGDGGGDPDMTPRTCNSLSFGTAMRIEEVQLNTARLIDASSTRIFLCRDDRGIYAVDAACTHLGCDVKFVDPTSGFRCDCHGATFDFNGEKETAPAPKPMTHYLVCATTSGTLVVDTEQPVPATVRYKV
jgi:Rieske Fe-S protein